MKVIKDTSLEVDVGMLKKCGKWVLDKIGEENKKINILVTEDERIKELNKKFRGVDSPTDVLAFPYHDKDLWGELVLSVDRIRENAIKYKVNEEEEILRVLIHGILHLFGESDETEIKARRMINRQESLLKEFKACEGLNSNVSNSKFRR